MLNWIVCIDSLLSIPLSSSRSHLFSFDSLSVLHTPLWLAIDGTIESGTNVTFPGFSNYTTNLPEYQSTYTGKSSVSFSSYSWFSFT
jgi:hypothetical protein